MFAARSGVPSSALGIFSTTKVCCSALVLTYTRFGFSQSRSFSFSQLRVPHAGQQGALPHRTLLSLGGNQFQLARAFFSASASQLSLRRSHICPPVSTSTHVRSLLSSSLANMSTTRSYEEAVHELNSLQTNAAVLDAQRKSGGKDLEQQLPEMQEQLTRAGISLDDLDRLRIIHVTGSKGKGSTCAFAESILRHHGRKTGLFTSPHLIEVRERIRINGVPLSREQFAAHFWTVRDRLLAGPTMPPYFRFTTIMALHVFLTEGVDVAVLEVGIGGRYDATNIAPRPVVCGVSALALEHTAILGTTLPQIAYHKGGIIKSGAPAFTVSQPPEPTATLLECATKAQTSLHEVPPLASYSPQPLRLGLAGTHQDLNASLAIQLSHYWLTHSEGPRLPLQKDVVLQHAEGFSLPPETVTGLAATRWPGRCQIVEMGDMTYLVDGAHTLESCTACAEWCHTVALTREPCRLILLFNCMGDRDPQRLLHPFAALHAHTRPLAAVHFCPNRLRDPVGGDLTNHMVSVEAVTRGPRTNEAAWAREIELQQGPTIPTAVHASVDDALDAIRADSAANRSVRTLVLVTGSLHLVGAVLTALQCPVE
eukprot:m.240487 g.240487  ORF g.240487 m.240487 type:complete len:596 (+) comp23416_c0_seq1:43-1830(+)